MTDRRRSVPEAAVARVGEFLGTALRLPGLRPFGGLHKRRLGAPPGIEGAPEVDRPPAETAITIRCVDYGPEGVQTREVADLDAFLAEPRSGQARVRWINVDGLHPYTINRLRQAYPFHTLAAEDVLHVPQRAKVEVYGDHLFAVVHMLMLRDGELTDEQVSFVLLGDTLLTFQERSGDVWEPVRKRIGVEGSRLRKGDAAYLLYALLDAVVDHFFPILEHFGNRLEEIEDHIVSKPTTAELHRLHGTKRELVLLRRVLWPMRQVTDDLQRSEFKRIAKSTRTYLRDVYDHTLQVLDIVETYREMTGGLTDLYLSSLSNRMNEVMKVLTILASLFIPVTFLAGVYGMNFEHIPELGWRWAYPTFWAACVFTTGGLLFYFHRKGWIGR